MEALPQDLFALCLLVFVLGVKHGFDADHLATIDGLTRFNCGRRLARWCGVFFSLGHGAVVIAIALAVSTLARQWQTPEWLELFGAWVSVAFLLGLGFVNVRAVLRAEPGAVVRPVGLKGRWLGRLAQASGPGCIALVGALFALSFDTVSQAALFAVAGVQYGGWREALGLGLLFMAGMLVTDGINGFWIARLLRRADATAAVASRVMSLGVAGVSLLVGGLGLARLASPQAVAWSEGRELFFGAAVVAIVAASFLLALRLTRWRPAAAGA